MRNPAVHQLSLLEYAYALALHETLSDLCAAMASQNPPHAFRQATARFVRRAAAVGITPATLPLESRDLEPVMEATP